MLPVIALETADPPIDTVPRHTCVGNNVLKVGVGSDTADDCPACCLGVVLKHSVSVKL
jgi:hypothetical protein